MSSRSPRERKFVGYISGKKILENRLNDELMWCLVVFHTYLSQRKEHRHAKRARVIFLIKRL